MQHTENPQFSLKFSFILGIGYSLRFNCLFRFLQSLRKRTIFDLYLGCTKHAAPHSESFDISSTPIRTKPYNS